MPTNSYVLNFKINALVLTSDGREINNGVVMSFLAYTSSITEEGKLPCDLRSWYNYDTQTANWAKIIPCTDAVKRIETQIVNSYLQITIPVEDLTYKVIQGYALSFLEEIYGKGNVEILK